MIVFLDGSVCGAEIEDCVKHNNPLEHVRDLTEDHREILTAPPGSVATVVITKYVDRRVQYEEIKVKNIQIGSIPSLK